jgi:hypothetical protein
MDHECWKDSSIVPECLSSELKTCCIRGYKGTKYELKFAKYIIENSKVLDTMTINRVCSSIDINEKHQMFDKLSSCTRGSTTCKLLFDWSHYDSLCLLWLNFCLINYTICHWALSSTMHYVSQYFVAYIFSY